MTKQIIYLAGGDGNIPLSQSATNGGFSRSSPARASTGTLGAVVAVALLLVQTHCSFAAATGRILFTLPGAGGDEFPAANLLQDSDGNLYGTSMGQEKHDYGTVFRLTPPASTGKGWTHEDLYVFPCGELGGNPEGG